MIRVGLAALLIAAPAWAQEGADIVVLGEIHDSAEAHARQAELVEALEPSALVFEMLSPAQVAGAAGVDRSDAAALGGALDWDEAAWGPFDAYAPIFAAAPDAALHGAALPREALSAIVAGEEEPGGRVPPLGDDLRAVLEAEQDAAHCGMLPPELLPGMVDAQRARDRHFADVALDAWTVNGPPVVVIAGTGHARTDVGVPAMIAFTDPQLSVWALGQVEGEVPEDAPFDSVEVVPAVERGDPCEAFR